MNKQQSSKHQFLAVSSLTKSPQKLAVGVLLLLIAAVLLARILPAGTVLATASGYPAPTDAAMTPYGSVGKWMLQPNGQVSNYGGQPYQGKTLIETVNIIIVDPSSKSELESRVKINTDMAKAGFPAQPVHSNGFKGLINGAVYDQLPGGILNAYSDNSFLAQNNHGRLFGPAAVPSDGYMYSGAFSTEKPTIYNWLPAHAYVSSNVARDALVRRLVASGQTQSIGVDMGNVYNTNDTTTGDHDGQAAVVVLK